MTTNFWQYNAVDIDAVYHGESNMNNNMISFGKNPRDQATEQALRRLKYLHTSLTNSKSRVPNLKPLQTTSFTAITALEIEDDEESASVDSNGDHKCLRLGPRDTRAKEIATKKNKRNLRTRLVSRPVVKAKSQVPHERYASSLRPSFSPITSKKLIQTKEAQMAKERGHVHTARNTKSAPALKASNGLGPTPDQYSCPACFAQEFDHYHGKSGIKYYPNININRVKISPRPQSVKETKSKCSGSHNSNENDKKSFRIPQTLYGGWGIRRGKTKEVARSSREPKGTMDVAMGLRTLKLEPKGSEGEDGKGKHGESFLPPPPAPPTPVRQIDIKMPEGYFVQFGMQTTA